MAYLHGVETIEDNSGTRTIRTVRTGVIGIVGVAPGVGGNETAKLNTGVEASNNAIQWVCKQEGAFGNGVSVHFKNPFAPSALLAISVDGRAITVSPKTSATGQIESKASEVISAIQANEKANALVTVTPSGSSTGQGVVTATPKPVFLTGGKDETFPAGKPVLIPGNPEMVKELGDSELSDHLNLIFSNGSPLVVVVRISPPGSGGAEAQIAGSPIAKTGIWSLLNAEAETGYKPKILIAPGYAKQSSGGARSAVVASLASVAYRLKAHAIYDVVGASLGELIDARNNWGDRELESTFPRVKALTPNGQQKLLFQSALKAAVIARTDAEFGFSESPSNKPVQGIVGLEKAIDFSLGDPNAEANLLNENEISTVIRSEGYRTWGGRTNASDPKYAFIPVARTKYAIDESIQRAHLWAVDNKIRKSYISSVVGSVNEYLSTLVIEEHIVNGLAWVDPALNTPAVLKSGRVFISYHFTPMYPSERLTFVTAITDEYLEEIFK